MGDIQAVYDADLVADRTLQTITTEHCLAYIVRLLDRVRDASRFTYQVQTHDNSDSSDMPPQGQVAWHNSGEVPATRSPT
jgi:hypothetical protein